MTLEIQLSPSIEAFYAQATAKGVPLERHLVEQLVAGAYNRSERDVPERAHAQQLNLPQLRGS